MKSFIILLVMLLPFTVTAQECTVQEETDPFTREAKLSTVPVPLKLSALSVEAGKKEFDFLFMLEGGGKCFDNNSTVVVFFEGNKQRNNFRNTGSMNCEGLFHFTVKNGPETPYMIKRLGSQKISQIVFTGNNKKQTILTLTPAQQDAVMQMINCIATEAKKLYQ